MNKAALQTKNYRKRTVAAGVMMLGLLAAGCGSSAGSEHSQHAVSNVAVIDEHSGHTANTQGDEIEHDTSENHSGHKSLEQMSAADIKLEWRYSEEKHLSFRSRLRQSKEMINIKYLYKC